MPPRKPVGRPPKEPQFRRASLRRAVRALAPHARRLVGESQQTTPTSPQPSTLQAASSTVFLDLTMLMELQREALQLTKELTVRVNSLEHLAVVPNPP